MMRPVASPMKRIEKRTIRRSSSSSSSTGVEALKGNNDTDYRGK